MKTRELDPEEWATFFEGFSRTHRGEPVTLVVSGFRDPSPLARDLPLLGVAAETRDGRVRTIEVHLARSIEEHLTHVVNDPHRVVVGQVSNGEDEFIAIEPSAEPAIELHFKPPRPLPLPGSGSGTVPPHTPDPTHARHVPGHIRASS